MENKVIGLIPARMASTRFPGKPLRKILNKPMICWVYSEAKKSKMLDELYVVTPDVEIYEMCQEYNMKCLYDPRQGDTAAQKISYESRKLDGNIYLNIQGDEPLIKASVIDKIITKMIENPDEYYVGLYNKIYNQEEYKKSSTVKVVLDADNYAMYFSRSPIPYVFEPGEAYKVVGVYGYRDWFLNVYSEIQKTPLEKLENSVEMIRMLQKGYKIKMLETDYEGIGVDLPEHIYEVEKRIIEKESKK